MHSTIITVSVICNLKRYQNVVENQTKRLYLTALVRERTTIP